MHLYGTPASNSWSFFYSSSAESNSPPAEYALRIFMASLRSSADACPWPAPAEVTSAFIPEWLEANSLLLLWKVDH